MVKQAYARAVETLRSDPTYPLLVPTVYELAAQYRRMNPGATLAAVREEAMREGLKLADVDACSMMLAQANTFAS